MPIKAVFFDLYHTLVGYDPPRENVQAEWLAELGVQVQPEKLRWPLVVADEYIYGEFSRTPMGKRSPEELKEIWANYERILLREAGIEPQEELIRGFLGRMREAKWKLVLFSDVAPALNALRARGLSLGLISNVDKDITPTLDDLGLLEWLGTIVTSRGAGATKPQPEIFLEAAKRCGATPGEMMYVGDQYQADAMGACNAGLTGVLLDRGDYFRDVNDCPRIQSLSELPELLNSYKE